MSMTNHLWTSECNKVNVRFTSHHDVSNENDVVGVIGSCKTLGNWEPESALLLERRGVKGCWSSLVRLPLSQYFEWKLIVIDRLTREIQNWEEYPNRWHWIDRGPVEIIAGWNSKEITRCSSCRCLVGLCCCTTIYSNLMPPEGLVNVTFKVIHSIDDVNETIALVGSSKFLGDWDPTYSRLFSAQHNPVLTIQLPVNTCFQWKLAILNSQHRKVLHWEEIKHRSLSVQTCPVEVGVTWGKTAEIGYRCFWLDPDWVVAPCPCGRRYCNNRDIKGDARKVKDLLDVFDNTTKVISDNRKLKSATSVTYVTHEETVKTMKENYDLLYSETDQQDGITSSLYRLEIAKDGDSQEQMKMNLTEKNINNKIENLGTEKSKDDGFHQETPHSNKKACAKYVTMSSNQTSSLSTVNSVEPKRFTSEVGTDTVLLSQLVSLPEKCSTDCDSTQSNKSFLDNTLVERDLTKSENMEEITDIVVSDTDNSLTTISSINSDSSQAENVSITSCSADSESLQTDNLLLKNYAEDTYLFHGEMLNVAQTKNEVLKTISSNGDSLANEQHKKISSISVVEKKTVKLVSFNNLLKGDINISNEPLNTDNHETEYVPESTTEKLLCSDNMTVITQLQDLSQLDIALKNEQKSEAAENKQANETERNKLLEEPDQIEQSGSILSQPIEQVENIILDCSENDSSFVSMSWITATSALVAVIVGSCIVDRYVRK
ncbi:uncharacterized protein LOC132748844 [Ruditapes philippinarum]|uniref:uncharacterized protein LOC132748844 n=1 Tax=Ruditapes philippinarum TaxID=129788 RepID=UPI00295B0A60|nr:uncharacterized protein LOC132748844 [Ruditapes philippinarum]